MSYRRRRHPARLFRHRHSQALMMNGMMKGKRSAFISLISNS